MPKKRAVARPKIKIGDLVTIAWIDASTTGGWKPAEDYAKLTPYKATSVGWIVSLSETQITLIQTVGESSMTDSITIPMPWTGEIKKLS